MGTSMKDIDDLDALRAFLPPETIGMLERHKNAIPRDLAIEEQMTILFSDMRGFTELAEKYDPHEVYASINASLSIQSGIVHRHGGSINKFLGDGLLACFSGEERGIRALNCLVEMLKTLPVRDGEGGLLPCKVGLGLHDGKVLLGLIGDESRRELTVIGDVVNTSARLCGIAQPFQGLVSEDAMNVMPSDEALKYCRFLNSIHFRGKAEPMNIFYIETD